MANSKWHMVKLISDLRLLIFGSCALLLAVSFSAQAQQPKKIPRVGYLSGTSLDAPTTKAFQQGLRDLGYIEGKNILVEYRFERNPDRIPSLVTELLQIKVDVLVIPLGILAAKQATKTIPIVMITNVDPVRDGIIDTLARPGGNITGVTRLTRELSGKRLELLKDVVPDLSRVGVLWTGDGPTEASSFKEYAAAAYPLNIQVESLEVHGPDPDLEVAVQAATKKRVNGIITARGPSSLRYAKRIANLAIKNRLPSMYEGIEYVQAGGLISYSASDAESFRRAASYVDKILKGAKPGTLPVEQPTKFELVINLKTAKQIGLTIPPNVLARADKIIR